MGLAIGIFGILNGVNVLLMYTVKILSTGEGIEAEKNSWKFTFIIGCVMPIFTICGFIFLRIMTWRFLYISANLGMSLSLGATSYFLYYDMEA